MLDKSIPYYNILMKRNAGTPIPDPILPEGFSYVSFSSGDERSWAEIEASVSEFDSEADALKYFQDQFLPYLNEVERRCMFIQSRDGEKVATFTCWWSYTGERRDAVVHWVAVKPSYQKLGLGKALVFEGMHKMLRIEGDRDVYLHTQTWSYKAIGIYLQAGFDFLKEGSFGDCKNDYEKAVPILKTKMPECFGKMLGL